MQITTQRKNLILQFTNDAWTDDVGDDVSEEEFEELSETWSNRARDFVVTSTDSKELHYFAQTWNWDCGPGLLKDLLSNPNCDFGTALMIFWLARPEYYLQYNDSTDVPDFMLEVFEFLSSLEEKMITGYFQAKTIRFDPTPEVGLYPESIAVAKRELPKMLYQQS